MTDRNDYSPNAEVEEQSQAKPSTLSAAAVENMQRNIVKSLGEDLAAAVGRHWPAVADIDSDDD